MLVELLELTVLWEELTAGAAALAAAGAAFWRRLSGRRAQRTMERIRYHYQVERELADRLRKAPARERAALYPQVYDELMRRVADHPQLTAQRRGDAGELRRRKVAGQAAMLERFVRRGATFMEVGAGDCALSAAMAARAGRVYAVEVSEEVARKSSRLPGNVTLAITRDCGIPVPMGSVDFAFSDQLMEHLHPHDARRQLAAIRASLAPRGMYFCITPNRAYGPSDVSAYFDDEATGLHLREYSARELRSMMLGAGFAGVRFYAGARSRLVPVPFAVVSALESVLELLPPRLRRRVAGFAPLRAVLGIRVLACN